MQAYFISFTDYVEIQLRKGAKETRIRANGAETGEMTGEDRNGRVDEMAGEDRNGRVDEMEQEVQCEEK